MQKFRSYMRVTETNFAISTGYADGVYIYTGYLTTFISCCG